MLLTPNILILLLIVALPATGIILLQILLAKKASKWPGLIMPIISFSIALLIALGMLLFSPATAEMTLHDNYGNIISQYTQTLVDWPTMLLSAGYLFMLGNIPTIILLLIYVACRGKHKQQRDLAKMNIQDLE